MTTSVVALGVRKGNPKGIQRWEDLTKPGVEVLYPSPKTSGGAMWDIIAIYGAGLNQGKQKGLAGSAVDQHAVDLVKRVQCNVKVMDKSGGESVTTFERGVGNVIVTYENELLPRIKQGRRYELVFPAETVVVENPIAVIDRNVDRHHVRDIADAFVSFLNGEEAQQAAAFIHPPHALTIAALGGWDHIFAALFGPQGAWTKAVEEVRQQVAHGRSDIAAHLDSH